MIEDAQTIFEYLPISFRNESEQEYVDFLWETFISNHTNNKFQFAFLAYHMLFMCFVYFEIWQIMQGRPYDFEKALVGIHKDKEATLLSATTPFTLKVIDESIVFRFLKLTGMNNSDIGKCTKIVRDRNDTAHASGNIFFKDERSLNQKINEILRCVEMIQNNSKDVIRDCYERFVFESEDPESREFINAEDQIREVLVYGNYLSVKDIMFLKEIDVTGFGIEATQPSILELAETLAQMYPDE